MHRSLTPILGDFICTSDIAFGLAFLREVVTSLEDGCEFGEGGVIRVVAGGRDDNEDLRREVLLDW